MVGSCFNTTMDTLGSQASREMTPSPMQNPHSSWLALTLFTLLALLILGEAFFAWNAARHSAALSSTPPTGTFYLSMQPTTAPGSNIYSFNVSTKVLTKISGTGTGLNLSPTVAPDGILYVSNDIGGGKYLKIPQIFKLLNTGSTTQLSETGALWKRLPQYSSALGEIVYEGRTYSKGLTSAPSDSGIFLLTKKDSGKFITVGSLPALTPDGKSVVVLRNDGLYMASLVASSTPEKIWGVDGGTTAIQDHFDISPDGSMIAWTIPDKGHVYIMRVDSWAPFSGHLVQDISATAMWPQFSPDNQYLAYIAFDLKNDKPESAQLTVQSLTSGERKLVQNLSDFNARSLFLTGWGR